MALFFHDNPRAFYDESFHGPRKMLIQDPEWSPGEDESGDPPMVLVDNPDCLIPEGAKLIEAEQYQALLDGQAVGKVITADADGYPVLTDQPAPTVEQLAEQERKWRDGELLATDQMVSRHRDELEENAATTLTVDQYAELQSYRRALRNWPENGEFPFLEHRPPAPDWLAAQIT
ncbi:phage tail assembly chaperone [Pseudomonas koreensis]|uniref:phage tail assembly chaperone n=1 Tax=Pseudomonas koreensis TaxID=198620 RepID=UPI0020779422|nr:phage tail assembly chaperone [Pseudomonas koreensis]MCM8743185.1 phage tail assembly chaperone [Pseudomonas koreensis]